MMLAYRAVIGLLAVTGTVFAAAPEPQTAVTGNDYGARVVRVVDGDSVTVQDAHGQKRKIRLAYIDAPELNQAHGQASHRHLDGLINQQTVTVTPFTQDRYGREVARLTFNGEDINLRQITDGMAWHYRSIARREQNKADFVRYAEVQMKAAASRRGLWSGQNPIAPWTWRQTHPPRGRAQ